MSADTECSDSNVPNKFQAFRLRSDEGVSGHALESA